MLDKKSEKFLKYVIDNQEESKVVSDIPFKCNDIGISYEIINNICKSLVKEGLIECINSEDGVYAVFLTHKGSVYFLYKFKTNLRFWLPFAVSAATFILTLLTYIKE